MDIGKKISSLIESAGIQRSPHLQLSELKKILTPHLLTRGITICYNGVRLKKVLNKHNKMISNIERAKSGNSLCQQCKKRIEAGELRGIDRYNSFGHITQKYFCKDCSIEVLELCKNAIQKMLNELVFHTL
jgi:hypothetical protein